MEVKYNIKIVWYIVSVHLCICAKETFLKHPFDFKGLKQCLLCSDKICQCVHGNITACLLSNNMASIKNLVMQAQFFLVKFLAHLPLLWYSLTMENSKAKTIVSVFIEIVKQPQSS